MASPRQPEPSPRVVSGRGVRLLSVWGVPVYFSPVAVLFAALAAASFVQVDADRLPSLDQGRLYLLGTATAIALLACLMLHEIGHAVVAKLLRFDVRSITLYGFVGLTEFRPEPRTPGRGFLIAVVGPLVNLAVGGLATLGYHQVSAATPAGVLLFDLAVLNVLIGALNLLPGLPLDGGQVLASAVWKLTGNRLVSLRIGAYGGFVVAGGIAAYSLSASSNGASTFWLMFAALLAVSAAGALRNVKVRSVLPGISAGGLARRAVSVPANLPLAEALRQAEQVGATGVIVLDGRGEPIAVMNGASVDAVPLERRPWMLVSEVSRSVDDEARLPARLTGEELLSAMSRHPASEYLVVDDAGAPVGVLATVDVAARVDPAVAARMARAGQPRGSGR